MFQTASPVFTNHPGPTWVKLTQSEQYWPEVRKKLSKVSQTDPKWAILTQSEYTDPKWEKPIQSEQNLSKVSNTHPNLSKTDSKWANTLEHLSGSYFYPINTN